MQIPRADEQPFPVAEKRYDSPTPWQIREEFHRLMREELVGPKDGEDEELLTLVEGRVSNRYLLGVLAPKNTHAPLEDEMEADDVESTEASEETNDELPHPAADSMLSTSIGMSFCVDEETTELRMSFAWAVYRKQRSEKGFKTDKRGDPAMVWKRVPYETTITFSLDKPYEDAPNPDFPLVRFRARVYPMEDGCKTVSVFLENAQDGKEIGDEAWLFQVRMEASHPGDRPCFLTRRHRHQADGEDRLTQHMEDHLALLYRKEVEFAMGHGASVDWEVSADLRRAHRIWTDGMPSYEVRKAKTPSVADVETRMEVLGNANQQELKDLLTPMVSAYRGWICTQRDNLLLPDEMVDSIRDRAAALKALDDCEHTAGRLEDGIRLVTEDPHAYEAFCFANRVMYAQRLHSLWAARRRQDEKAPIKLADIAAQEIPSWRLFQLAFILISLPSLTQLDHPERCEGSDPMNGPTAELLWFSTGGGKTEAYLGLTAYTLALRRLQGTVEGYDGENGVAVLMRYTLRLLTLQQFQRATTMICACEVERRNDTIKWGKTPFRIGLWVGMASTPNTVKQAVELLQTERVRNGSGGRGTLKQLTSCPWCGSKIELGRDVEADRDRERIIFYCGNPKGNCDFSRRNSKDEGVPIVVVDEQVFRMLPSLVIATVDKFAQMPWNGETSLLFGRVTRKCPRHGFLCPDSNHDQDSHNGRNGFTAVKVEPTAQLRPPDLIIQDELHLITGPLGSLVGLYETAVDELCSWTVNGKVVRPKVILSTATIKRAHIQVQKLFNRRLQVFPPRALNVDDTFFAREDAVSEQAPGLRYVGVCAFGRRLKTTLIRVYIAALCSAQTLHKLYPGNADQLMTLVGYFASLRELGAMRRLLDDSVKSRCKYMNIRGLEPRDSISIEEMTSRRRAADIPYILSRLETKFPDDLAKRKDLPVWPIDVLIATNMISVGVDVPRLGMMVVTGQPKATAEYIQATSRVGRDLPGIVFTVFNYSRPRDVSHYEAFRGYHSAYHMQVENPSVTPFSAGAVDRGLSAVVVALSRLQEPELNADHGAQSAPACASVLEQARNSVVSRAAQCADDQAEITHAEQGAQKRVDIWSKKAHNVQQQAAALNYKRLETNRVPLLRKPEDGPWMTFTCLNSLRGVEQASHLVLLDSFDGPESESEESL